MAHEPSSTQRLELALNLAEALDGAYLAFGEMLIEIRRYQDSGAPFHAGLVMAAAAAADGRDAVARAPSLPPPAVHDRADVPVTGSRATDAAAFLARLSQAVAAALRQAAAKASGVADRQACDDGARYADEVHSLTSGNEP